MLKNQIKLDSNTLPNHEERVRFRRVNTEIDLIGNYYDDEQVFLQDSGDFAYAFEVESWESYVEKDLEYYEELCPSLEAQIDILKSEIDDLKLSLRERNSVYDEKVRETLYYKNSYKQTAEKLDEANTKNMKLRKALGDAEDKIDSLSRQSGAEADSTDSCEAPFINIISFQRVLNAIANDLKVHGEESALRYIESYIEYYQYDEINTSK
jgi:chromosome segregation ATPase